MHRITNIWIASILSYIRYEYGGRPPRRPGEIPGMVPAAASKEAGFTIRKIVSPVVTPQEVKKIREENKGRSKPWTIEELKAVSGQEDKEAQSIKL